MRALLLESYQGECSFAVFYKDVVAKGCGYSEISQPYITETGGAVRHVLRDHFGKEILKLVHRLFML